MNSIVSSYASAQRNRLPVAPSTTTTTTTTTTLRPGGQFEAAKPSWPYYQSSAEAQKNFIYEDIQRKIANGTSTGNAIAAWRNVSSNSIEHQRRYRAKHHRLYSKGKRPKNRPPRDCKVGDWGAWSACSRSCGVGETQRTRRILIKPRRGGQACPPLKETKWCGSVSPCPAPQQPKLDSYGW